MIIKEVTQDLSRMANSILSIVNQIDYLRLEDELPTEYIRDELVKLACYTPKVSRLATVIGKKLELESEERLFDELNERMGELKDEISDLTESEGLSSVDV